MPSTTTSIKIKDTVEIIKLIQLILKKKIFVAVLFFYCLISLPVVSLRWLNPPKTTVILAEEKRIDAPVQQEWQDLETLGPNVSLTIVAAEDANFCNHWGLDFVEIMNAMQGDYSRGASTITQQVARNVFLWRGRSWLRKGLEVGISLMMELYLPKRRILEIYTNIAETGNGYFGIQAISKKSYKMNAGNLSLARAARIAVILPNPKKRDPRNLKKKFVKKAKKIQSGALTIKADGRADCFL